MALREKGLTCLGLCCLIARVRDIRSCPLLDFILNLISAQKMASSSFQLFLQQVKTAPEVLKLRVLEIIFDILMVHEGVFLGPSSPHNEQIIGFLREAEAGLPVKELCRRHGFSETSYYLWRSKFGGMSVPDAKRLKELETENARLKKLLAEQVLENEVIKDVLRKKW